jgi:hypothetical protein
MASLIRAVVDNGASSVDGRSTSAAIVGVATPIGRSAVIAAEAPAGTRRSAKPETGRIFGRNA